MVRYDVYLFDVQGTLGDFFGPVSRALAGYVAAPIVGDVVRAWRRSYFERVAGLSQSAKTWHPVHEVYREGLAEVSAEFGLDIPEEAHADLAAAWARLEPWPDVPDGLRQLRREAMIATLSNTDMVTMVRLFKNLGIDWDAILTAELFGAFKPAPLVYLRACRYLGVEPSRAAMVAAHPYDLRAARDAGLATIFVHRPMEFGRIEEAIDDTVGEFDHRVDNMRDLP